MKSLANFRECSLAPATRADYKADRRGRRWSAPGFEAETTGAVMASLDKRGKISGGATVKALTAQFAAVRSYVRGRKG
jgi:hypothetical protein